MLPREVISLTTYAQLDLYLEKFAVGEFGLLLLLGWHGTGKSESVRRALDCSSSDESNGEQPSSPRSGAGSQRPWSTAPEAGELYRDVLVIIQIKFSLDIRVLFFT